jgi:hypothetical protein
VPKPVQRVHSVAGGTTAGEPGFEPRRVGFNGILCAERQGGLAWCESVKTWVLLGSRDDATWQRDGDRVAELSAAEGVPGIAGGTQRVPAEASLLDALQEEGIVALTANAAQDLQQRCNQMLLSKSRLVAEAFHALWQKQPWQAPPAQVRRAIPKRMDLSAVEQLLGHKFSNPLVAVRALTHSSYMEVRTPDFRSCTQHCAHLLAAQPESDPWNGSCH